MSADSGDEHTAGQRPAVDDAAEAVATYRALADAIRLLRLGATEGGVRNYVAITFGGMALPFDRAEITLVRPGGMTPHEARQKAEDALAADAALLAAARLIAPGLLEAMTRPDRRPVIYLAHPVGAPTIEGVRANLARAKRWLWALRQATAWSVCAPWIPAVEACLDSGAAEHDERARGLADDLAVVERCDAIVLVGGRVSSGMALERDHAVACGLRVVDLTGEGEESGATLAWLLRGPR